MGYGLWGLEMNEHSPSPVPQPNILARKNERTVGHALPTQQGGSDGGEMD